MEKAIKNIGLLDLTSATKESLRGATQMKNIGMILLSEDSADILKDISMKNVGSTVTVPKSEYDVNTIMGEGTINKQYLESIKDKLILVVMGHLHIENDVTNELIKEKIENKKETLRFYRALSRDLPR